MKKVSIRDLFFYLLERIIFILVLGILIASLLGLKYYLEHDKIDDVSKSSIAKIEEVYAVREIYDDYVESQENSGILEFDYKDYYFSRATYKLSGVSLGSPIYEMIIDDINNDDFREELAEKSGTRLDTVSLGFLAGAWKTDIDDYSLFYYDVKTGNEEDGEKIIAIADEMVSEVANKYISREKGAKWEKTDIWTHHFGEGQNYLVSTQNKFKEALEQADLDRQEAEATLSDAEKLYYKKNYLNESISLNKKKLIKKMAVGFIIGVVLMGGIFSYIYMFNGYVKSVEELKILFDLPLIALIDKKESKNDENIKHGFFRQLRYRFDSKKYAKEVLRSHEGKFVLLYDKNNESNLPIVNDIASDIPKFQYLHLDAAAQESCKEYQSAIIVVQLGKIKHVELERELEVCSMCGIDINGVVAIV